MSGIILRYGFAKENIGYKFHKKTKNLTIYDEVSVGAARFELTTSWSQTRRDTGLRYAPSNL